MQFISSEVTGLHVYDVHMSRISVDIVVITAELLRLTAIFAMENKEFKVTSRVEEKNCCEDKV